LDHEALWANCEIDRDDPEVHAIDRMGEAIAPVSQQGIHIRSLISRLEMCHHKAARHVEVILQAIGEGGTAKTPRALPCGKGHPAVDAWSLAADVLQAWCGGDVSAVAQTMLLGEPAGRLVSLLGVSTPLKRWQVRQVVAKLRRSVQGDYWSMVIEAESPDDPEHRAFSQTTKNTIIRDTVDGAESRISLADAINNLQPCNWNFAQNLRIVLGAINGDLSPASPFAAHARNIALNPIRTRMDVICDALGAFWRDEDASAGVDESILRMLGEGTPESRWLAASLDKTIRLQLGHRFPAAGDSRDRRGLIV
jgi:hypothetical protein